MMRAALGFVAVLAFTAIGMGKAFITERTEGFSKRPSQELFLFATSSLTGVMSEMALEFERRNPGTSVVRNFASSVTLSAQLREGEAADLFASADEKYMKAVRDAGLIEADAPVLFASNRLIVIVPASNPAQIGSFEDLGKRKLALVLGAPGVPVRNYTDEMVDKIAVDPEHGEQFRQRFYGNLASEESNVRQVASRVALGEADAGVVYATDVTADIADRVKRLEIPARYNITARYPIAVLRNAPQAGLAREFLQFLLSGEGRAMLSRHGFATDPPVK